MNTFAVAAPEPQGTVHVALIAEDGTPIIHEELPAAKAPQRQYMLGLQAELDAAGLGSEPQPVSRRVYAGEVWPPPGHTLDKGKLAEAPQVAE